MPATDEIQLTKFVPQEATDQDWAYLNDFMAIIQSEKLPDDPPLPAGYTRQNWQAIPPVIHREAWLLRRPGGDIVGNGYVDLFQMAENRHAAQADIMVHPDLRRQRLGSRLLAEIARTAAADERRLLLFMTLNTIPAGDAFMESFGANRGLETTESQLAIADVQKEMLHAWQTRAAERAGGYELVLLTGSYSEDWLVPMATIKKAMNEAPTDDLDVEDINFTPDILRQIDASLAQRHIERWTLLAREKATGEPAGSSEITFPPHKPTIGNQGDTAVLEAHRGRGLGRWLKAEMLLRVLAEKPQIEFIRTNNANSNAPMLKINHQMGFQPYISTIIWQVDVDKL